MLALAVKKEVTSGLLLNSNPRNFPIVSGAKVSYIRGVKTSLGREIMHKSNLSVAAVRDVLAFDPETGIFTWKVPPSRRVSPGQRAGSISQNGRRYIAVFGESVISMRLAWFYVHGEWPAANLAPADGDYDNAALTNLKPETMTETAHKAKVRSTNRSGMKGVSWSLSKSKWVGTISRDGRRFHLGYFATVEDAGAAVRAAEENLPEKPGAKADWDEMRRTRHRARIIWNRLHANAQPVGWVSFDEFMADVIEFPTLDQVLVAADGAIPVGPQNFAWVDKHVKTPAAVSSKKYREANADYFREKKLAQTFGISLAEYTRMHTEQAGVCAICSQPESATRGGKTKWLSVDHNHTTGAVRGLLCSDCNTGIGKLGDSVERLTAAAAYLKLHAAPAENADNVVPLTKKAN